MAFSLINGRYSFIFSANLFSQELITQENIHEAVDACLDNPTSTEAQYGHISDWDVSSVTNMSGLFSNAYIDNIVGQAISNWDVSNVTNMNNLFFQTNFNGDLSSWDVSNVISMSGLFTSALNFNGDTVSYTHLTLPTILLV